MIEQKQNSEIDPTDPTEKPVQEPTPKPQPVEDPEPGHRGPVNDPQPGPEPEPDAPEPGPEPPQGDPPSHEPGVSAAPALVLTSKPAPEKEPARPAPASSPKKKQEDQPDQSPFSVTVGQVYNNPHKHQHDLIRKQDIDIYDIPISRITAQFLAYVDQLKATDVDVAGDFINTASLLIHIKSKMLLPRAPAGPDDAAEDPRRELVERLLAPERFKNAAQMLQQIQILEAAT